MTYEECCEKAAELIRDDLTAGAVEQYIDGETAQQYLGELIRLNCQPRATGEEFQDWIRRIGVDMDLYISRIFMETEENNVLRIADEESRK